MIIFDPVMEISQNDILTIKIDDLGVNGEGIGKHEGFTIFTDDAIIGDVVEAKVLIVKKNYATAQLKKIVTPSKDRVEPQCEFHYRCGGCQIQNLDYRSQLIYKQNKVKNNLVRTGGFSESLIDSVLQPIEAMENPFHYRNKALFPIGVSQRGNPIAGFYAIRSHSIVSNTSCIVGASENEAVLNCILDFMNRFNVSAFNENTRRGIVRHVLIRKAFATGQLMVCVVVNADKLPDADKLAAALMQIDGMTSVSYCINKGMSNVIMGTRIIHLAGQKNITDFIGNVKFNISPLSFFQVNPLQTQKLYAAALDFAALTGKEIVWDLYCGIGTISLFLAQKARKVCGVEIVDVAIDDARKNALLNNIENAEFFCGKAEDVITDFYQKNSSQTPDVIVVDPPRKGCDKLCIETMIKVNPKKIVYVSCDPATLSRDLKILAAAGYQLKKAMPVDMFPHTVHVETVVLMEKQ